MTTASFASERASELVCGTQHVQWKDEVALAVRVRSRQAAGVDVDLYAGEQKLRRSERRIVRSVA
jgi:hypothetical protein